MRLILLLTSCKEGESIKSIVDVEESSTEIISDSLEINDLEETFAQNYELTPFADKIVLTEKVFNIESEIDLQTCKTFDYGCDCCNGKLVFIDEYIFIEEFYCIPYNNFYIGYYNIFGDKIKLYYETKYVSHGPEDGQDYDGDYIYKLNQDVEQSVTVELLAFNCNGNFIIKSKDSYYSESETITTTELLEHYSKDEFWDLLNVTEIIENFNHKK